jgi:hypothetical protein
MPEFNARTPQEANEPNKLPIVSIANRVRNLLIATRLRTLLIGGGILLFVVVAVPVGLLIYPSSGLAVETVTCDQWLLGKTGECVDTGGSGTVEACKADSRAEVDDATPCRVPPWSTVLRRRIQCLFRYDRGLPQRAGLSSRRGRLTL